MTNLRDLVVKAMVWATRSCTPYPSAAATSPLSCTPGRGPNATARPCRRPNPNEPACAATTPVPRPDRPSHPLGDAPPTPCWVSRIDWARSTPPRDRSRLGSRRGYRQRPMVPTDDLPSTRPTRRRDRRTTTRTTTDDGRRAISDRRAAPRLSRGPRLHMQSHQHAARGGRQPRWRGAVTRRPIGVR
jgi:hypothetical protein